MKYVNSPTRLLVRFFDSDGVELGGQEVNMMPGDTLNIQVNIYGQEVTVATIEPIPVEIGDPIDDFLEGLIPDDF